MLRVTKVSVRPMTRPRSRDVLSPADRSLLMARIRGNDTWPERAVRSLVHGLG